MAGEWITYDVCTPQKPEILELVELTSRSTPEVVGLVAMLWGWAALNCEDGVAKMTPPRLVRLIGGDVQFWEAVEKVGWIAIDREAGTISVAGWDARFSKSAKERALKARRAAEHEATHVRRRRAGQSGAQAPDIRRSSAGQSRAQAPDVPRSSAGHSRAAAPQREEREERDNREEKESEPPAAAAPPPPALEEFLGNLGKAGVETPRKAPAWLLAAMSGEAAEDMLRASKELQRSFMASRDDPPGLANFRNREWVARLASGEFRDRTKKPPPDPARRRWWRAEFGRSMTDEEYLTATIAERRGQPTGPDSPPRPVMRVING